MPDTVVHRSGIRRLYRHWTIGGAVWLLVASALGSTGCALSRIGPRSPSSTVREFTTKVRIHHQDLTLHLASPVTPTTPSQPLVLYASGDGGWFGAAAGMFRTIVQGGAPAVGFSTRSFLKLQRAWSRPVTVPHLAEAYQLIIDRAREQLALPADTPVVLSGWSRGASLAVLVASSHAVDPALIGVVAIGLAADEELEIDGDSDDDAAEASARPDPSSPRPKWMFAMYQLTPHIAPRRCIVIQATKDGYLPAARARELFGADSESRRLVAVEARNHSFGGGESKFAEALRGAIEWMSAKP